MIVKEKNCNQKRTKWSWKYYL